MEPTFTQLPSEMVGEVLDRLSPVSLRNTLLSSKNIYQEHGTYERKEYLKGESLRQKMVEEGKVHKGSYVNEWFYLTTPYFTQLLGPSFPMRDGRALSSYFIINFWIDIYVKINELYAEKSNDLVNIIILDSVLSTLIDHPELQGREIELSNYIDQLVGRQDLVEFPSLTGEETNKLKHINRYLNALLDVMNKGGISRGDRKYYFQRWIV